MSEQNSQLIVARLLPEATRRLIRTADGLDEDDLRAPSGLPGWSRADVLAHLALNAEGLAGALAGVVEGERTPMYLSQEARDGDIAAVGAGSPPELRDRLLAGTTALADALDALPGDRWDAVIERVPGGRTFTAGDVPWMRLSEVEIHHADLAAGYGPRDWPPAYVAQLLDVVGARRSADDLALEVHATDLDRTWRFGDGGPTVSGTGADLGWWLTGRGAGDGLSSDSGALPRIGAW